MKVLMVVDSLGSGGAQRQLSILAKGLHERGIDVKVLVYSDVKHHFEPYLTRVSIPIIKLGMRPGFLAKFILFIKLWKLLYNESYDWVISFQTGANILSTFSILTFSKTHSLISERTSRHAPVSPIRRLAQICTFVLCNRLVTNSYDRLVKEPVWVKKKSSVILNGYPLKEFKPIELKNSNSLKNIAIIARLDKIKNPIRLIDALLIFESRFGFIPHINWYGRTSDSRSKGLFLEIESLLKKNKNLEKVWSWRGEVDNIEQIFSSNDCLLHVSLYEGFPNVVCEAMLYGLPIVCSDVCDNGKILENGDLGILCNPLQPYSIFLALDKINNLSFENKKRMVDRARLKAQKLFDDNIMVNSYLDLLKLNHDR